MEPHFRNSDKSKISGKRYWISLLEIEKKASKTLILFRNYWSRFARVLSSIQSELAGLEERKCF